MRHLTLLTLSLLSTHLSYSQIHEIGIFLGGSNFIGDVGATNYISPNQLAFGGLYKWNRSARHSYRISFMYSNLEGIDADSDDPKRTKRGYVFSNGIIEISAGMEFTFFDFDLHAGTKIGTPYLYTGASIANHDNYYFDSVGISTSEGTSSWAYGIPMVLGFKTTFIKGLILGVEVGARYTFSDELDGSIPDSKDPAKFIGNINNNDWYVFSGITLTYTFGQNPCYCPSN